MTTRFIFCFLFLLSMFGTSSAQERKIIFEEIQKKPDNQTGEWVVGGKKLIVDRSTRIAGDDFAEIGNLAVIEYYVKDSRAHITQMQAQPVKAADVNDGPYVIWRDEKTAEVITMTAGKVERKVIENITEPRELERLNARVKTITLDPQPPMPPKSQWDAPNKLLAISDLEGNYLHTVRFLQNNNVLDDEENWIWGDGHLVLVGDLVDRGQAVTEVMWLVKRLEREAQAAGGQVHYVLGNHEAMVMKGDLRYINPKYHFVTERLGITYDDLYGPDSEIGRWWRSKNAVVRVGDLLFVHGGYSPLLDDAELGFDELNNRIRAGLDPAQPTGVTVADNPVEHIHGPFWYRGYFKQHALAWGGQASPKQIQRILDRHQAKHVVVGHTVVDQIGPIDETGLVIGVDVKWTDSRKCQGLLQANGKLYRLTMTGQREEILAGVKN